MEDRPWKHQEWFGTRDDLYAVGAVIAAWNLCEQALQEIVRRTLKLEWETSERIFQLLGNQSRTDLLRLEGKRLLSEEEFNHVSIFSRYYSICGENRNLIAHASINRNAIQGGVSLSKISSKDRLSRNEFSVSQAEMIEVADAIYDLGQFGFFTAHAIWAGPTRMLFVGETAMPMPLPDIFPQPRKLTPRPEAQNSEPRQRRSSRVKSE